MKGIAKLAAVTAAVVLVLGAVHAWAQGGAAGTGQAQHRIHDANNDGTCDICGLPTGSGQRNAQGVKAKKGNHFGPGNGTGNQGAGPKDGTGYGSQSGKRTGPQDGSQARMGRQNGQGSANGARRGSRGGRP